MGAVSSMVLWRLFSKVCQVVFLPLLIDDIIVYGYLGS